MLVVGAAGAAIGLVGRHIEEMRRQARQAQEDTRRSVKEAAAEIKGLREQLEEQTELTVQVIARINRGAEVACEGGKRDPVLSAQADVAGERGVSVDELKLRIEAEGADVRKLVAAIEQCRAAAAAGLAEDWRALEGRALTRLGKSEYAAGHYTESIEPSRQGLALMDEQNDPGAWCNAAWQLQWSLEREGLYPEAETLARRIAEKRATLQGAASPEALGFVDNLADLLCAEGDYAEAEPLYRRALEGLGRTMGKDHPDTLECVNNLACLLYARGDYAGAEPLLRRALEANERTLGKDHADTLRSVNNLASLLEARGDCADAAPLYRRALEARERTLGKDHPDTLASLNNLAWFLAVCPQSDLRDGKQAEECATNACERSRWNIPAYVNTLAAACAEAGDFEAAIKWENKYMETPNLGAKERANAESRLELYEAHTAYHEGRRNGEE